MKEGFGPGIEAEITTTVADDHVIRFMGDDVIPVLSTPSLLWELEAAARKAVEPYLESGENSVGTKVSIDHLAATPIGMRVTSRARVTAVDRRRIEFAVEAFDEREKIAQGTHERFIVDVSRFAGRVEAKRG